MDVFNKQLQNGLKWSFLGQGSGQVLNILISIIMARMILPETYGKLAMVNVIIGFSSIFIGLGFGAGIIQKKEVDQKLLSSVFWVNVIIGSFLFVLMFALSEVIASFYEDEELSDISKILSTLFVISALGAVPGNIMTKKMEFRQLVSSSILSTVIGGSVGIALAYLGYEIEAVIAHVLLQRVVGVIYVFVYSRWTPAFFLSLVKIKEISSFSFNVLGNNTLNYWVRNVDSLLIGKFLGATDLGVYNKSYTFLTLPLNTISGSISQVLFPSFSSIQNDKGRVKETYLKIIESVSIVVFPAMIGLFVVADEFILIVLGENWIGAIPVIRVFCVLAINQSIGTLISNLYLSQGRSGLMLKVTTPLRIMLIISILIGLNWGVLGVAVSYTFAGYLSSFINHFFAGRLVGLHLKNYVNSLVAPLVIAISMGVIVFVFDWTFLSEWSNLYALGAKITIGLISFFMMVEIFKPRHYIRLKVKILSYLVAKKDMIFSSKRKADDGIEAGSYWEKRAKKYGKKAVYNLGHDDSNLDRVTENQKNEIFPFLDKYKGRIENVLDFGCGPGRFSGALSDYLRAQVVAVDPIDHFLRLAPKHARVEYRLLNQLKFDLKGKYDLVWVCLVLGGIVDNELKVLVENLEKVTHENTTLCLVENTSKGDGSEHWKFRSYNFYKLMFSNYNLKLESTYYDMGEEISIMIGTKEQ